VLKLPAAAAAADHAASALSLQVERLLKTSPALPSQ
jgi:hypothetical protein